MKPFKTAIKILVLIVVLAGAGIFIVQNWSWVFSKRIKGEVLSVERVTQQTAILGSRVTDAQMHTYSILIQGEDGRLYTSSSSDSQWQVVKKGYCVEALLYRYPPWRLSLANTFFNARILELRNCKGKDGEILPLPEEPPVSPESTEDSPPPQ